MFNFLKKIKKKTKSVANGTGSLYFSNSLKCWVFQYVKANGKRQTVKQKKKESTRDFKARVEEIRKSKLSHPTSNSDIFINILKKYVEQKHKDGITSDSSYARELETLKQINKICFNFINKPIQEITIEDIEESKSRMREYSNTVISKIWTLINKTFQIATSRRKIQFNIMLDETLTKPISKRPETKVEALSIEEEKKLIRVLNKEELNNPYRNIVLLQLYTGMRIGEVLALSKNCVNLDNNTITVYRTLTYNEDFKIIIGEHTKTYKKNLGIDKGKRTFPMNKKVRTLIEQILQCNIENPDDLLFYNNEKKSFYTSTEVNSYLAKINKKYKITSSSLHSHRLRHTFITRCVEKGMVPKVIQSLVGHANGSKITSDVYTSISNEFMIKELKKIS